jgi:hypothetical protein
LLDAAGITDANAIVRLPRRGYEWSSGAQWSTSRIAPIYSDLGTVPEHKGLNPIDLRSRQIKQMDQHPIDAHDNGKVDLNDTLDERPAKDGAARGPRSRRIDLKKTSVHQPVSDPRRQRESSGKVNIIEKSGSSPTFFRIGLTVPAPIAL